MEKQKAGGGKRALTIAWGAVVVCMALIFYFSAQGSLGGMKWPPIFQALRKSAHIIEYGALAILIGRAIVQTAAYRGRELLRAIYSRAWWLGVVLATLYAVSDEVHQSFVPGRGGHIEDVIIDALSATAALGIWFIMRAPQGRAASNRRAAPQARQDTSTELRPEIE